MKFRLDEKDVLEAFRNAFPEETFESGRLLAGQQGQNNIEVFYLGTGEHFNILEVEFNTFNFIEATSLSKDIVSEIRLKDGLLFRKMFVVTPDQTFTYKTSKILLSDFQKKNYDYFIAGQKERVIYKDGKFL